MVVAVGHSEDIDSDDAVAEVLAQCAEGLHGAEPRAGLLYAGIDHDLDVLLDAVASRYPHLQLIGGTTHGELSSSGFAEDSVALMLIHSDRTVFRSGVGRGAREDPAAAAREAVAMATAGLDAPVRLCITIPEGVRADGHAIVAALNETLGGGVPICGGMAADPMRQAVTYQFCNGTVYTDSVPVLLFAGALSVSTGVASGWSPIGEPHTVTRSEGHVIFDVDDEPIREFWTRYSGSMAMMGARLFVAVYPPGSDEYFITAPFAMNDDGGLVMLSPVPPGTRLRFTEASRDQIVSGARASADRARAGIGGGDPAAALVFSCASRRRMLGTRVGLEFTELTDVLGPDLPMLGFYTNGEFCPLPGSSVPRAHNSTFVTVLIRE